MTAEHLLEDCSTYAELRQLFLPLPAPTEDKLYGCVGNMKLTSAFFTNIQFEPMNVYG